MAGFLFYSKRKNKVRLDFFLLKILKEGTEMLKQGIAIILIYLKY